MNISDLLPASEALKVWFQSQDLLPNEAVMIAEMFIAQMIVENTTSDKNRENKFQLLDKTTRKFVVVLEMNNAR